MKPFFSALGFLTTIPVPINWVGDEKTMARSMPFFPVVGCIIGGITGAVAWLCCRYVAADFVSAVLISLVPALLSGGLHLDGLSDSADGLLSARTKERMLEIMKDSNVGAMGVLVLVFTLLLKVGLLAHLIGHLTLAAPIAALMPLAGRCTFSVMMTTVPYARTDGLGGYFWQRSPLTVIWSMGILGGLGYLLLGVPGIVSTIVVLIFAVGFSVYCSRRIGGGTGDTLGALCELSEIAFLCAAMISLTVQ